METRRVRGDQIEVFKITHGIEDLDSGMFFKYKTDNRTRGHSWALAKERCKLDIRKYAFSQRTINEWNRLPGECVKLQLNPCTNLGVFVQVYPTGSLFA